MILELLKSFWEVTQLHAPGLFQWDDELSLADQAQWEPFSSVNTHVYVYK